MRTLRVAPLPLPLLAGLLLSGCVLRPGTVVRRFSGEFVCPEKHVKVEQLDKERYRASGCNRRATYRCSGEYGELCERIGQPETIRHEEPVDESTAPPADPALSGEPAAAP